MTYTEKELDQFLHGISLSLLSKKSAQHWRYDEETAKEIEWLEALERKVRADKADRKTEPQTCDTCKWGEWYRKGYDITMMSDECGGCCSWNNKWKPKTEPQRGCDADCNEDCTECAKEWQDWKDQMWTEAVIASKDEPQTDCSWK